MGNLLVSRREDYERKEKENDELIEELGDRVSKLESGQQRGIQDFSGRGGGRGGGLNPRWEGCQIMIGSIV